MMRVGLLLLFLLVPGVAALGKIADAITPAECANYLRNSGHFQSA